MKKINILIGILFLLVLFNIFLYSFDKIATPTLIAVADAEMRARCMEIVNKVMSDEYSKAFNYDEIIRVDKDQEGNIVMLKADTLKMNKIACDVSIKSQDKLREFGEYGIKLPLGYVFKNNLLAYFGPNIKIKMQPIGSIETKYHSEFESAGINQTRQRIYVSFKTNVRIILASKGNDIEINNEIPISETIIVGKIPSTAVQLDLQSAGYATQNSKDKKGGITK
jgi:sporulation protein YunB